MIDFLRWLAAMTVMFAVWAITAWWWHRRSLDGREPVLVSFAGIFAGIWLGAWIGGRL